ncbi:MAG: hydantoinase/carbamoylase family amidase [Ginsengibacter sp.]
MKESKKRAEKIEIRIQELVALSSSAGAINRAFGTLAFIEYQQKIESWMKLAGLQTFIDNIGNVRGRLLSKNPMAKTFVIGSHFDNVREAASYDGALGVLAGLDLLETLIAQSVSLPFNIELIAFSESKGSRFNITYLGSKIIAGNFDSDLLGRKDVDGISLNTVLESLHYNSNQIIEDKIPGDQWLGYFEIHIEHGPVLFKNDLPVGIVTAIDGVRKISIEFTGVEAHAGTVPMKMRTDALCTAAEFVLAVEQFALSKKSKVVASIGNIAIKGNPDNIIPAKVNCILDIRSGSKKKLSKAYQILNEICEQICDRRKVYFEWRLLQELNPVVSDDFLNKLLSKAVNKADVEVFEMESGTAHDAISIAPVAPFCMLFVKCVESATQNQLERVEIQDIATALEVGDYFIEELSLRVWEEQI